MYKILLPTDGSDVSQNAIKQGIAFAKALNSDIVALHVVPQFHMPRDEGDLLPTSTTIKERVDQEHKARAQRVLASVEEQTRSAGVKCESVVGISDAIHEEIINTAGKHNCNLIIMASHGHAGMSALLLGSETAKVLTHTNLPVLVVHG